MKVFERGLKKERNEGNKMYRKRHGETKRNKERQIRNAE
jgi:hypothetical protein